MPEAPSAGAGGWLEADRIAALFATDPAGLGGVVVRAPAGPARDAWLAALTALLPPPARLHRLPLQVDDDRLLGGLDLTASLHSGRLVAQRGLLAEADGGVLLLAMAERLSAGTAARIAAVLDTGERVAERDGIALRAPSRIGVVALDEGIGEDEGLAPRLAERLAFRLEIGPEPQAGGSAGSRPADGTMSAGHEGADAARAGRRAGPLLGMGRPTSEGLPVGATSALAPTGATSGVTPTGATSGVTPTGATTGLTPAGRSEATGRWPRAPAVASGRLGLAAVLAARELLPWVTADDATVEALCAAALALGIDSVRAPILALRVARASAALAGRSAVEARDAALAARLVLAWRATRLPPEDDAEASGNREQAPPDAPGASADAANAPLREPGDPAVAAEAEPSPQAAASSAQPPEGPAPRSEPAASSAGPVDSNDPLSPGEGVDDIVLQAALASIPAHLLDRLQGMARAGLGTPSTGRSGAAVAHPSRGRPCGSRRGEPRRGARLDLIQTLRAAAPWQKLRRQAAESMLLGRGAGVSDGPGPGAGAGAGAAAAAGAVSTPSGVEGANSAGSALAASAPPRVLIRREDFHITRFEHRSETTTVFVVDASGSSALHRLAEAKGAVELLLADCYVRRDQVAVIAFRGRGAELLLPPTRSLLRAKRSLAGLPGGGGTPLAAGLAAAANLVDAVRRRGASPVVVLLTDGRANIALDGSPGRERATGDALAAAGRLRAAGCSALLIDTSAQPQPSARALASALGGAYLPLPHADAPALSRAVLRASKS